MAAKLHIYRLDVENNWFENKYIVMIFVKYEVLPLKK